MQSKRSTDIANAKLFGEYRPDGHFDEWIGPSGEPRREVRRLADNVENLGGAELQRRAALAERSFRSSGITFTVYEDDRGVEKIFPFDLLPRIITRRTWQRIEAGLRQRVEALNLFLEDIYHERRILKEGVIPPSVVLSSPLYRPELHNFPFPHGIHSHISGIDLVRDAAGEFHVLEDNLRTPSGVSYMLANRQILKRVGPELFEGYRVLPIEGYSHRLLANLRGLAPQVADPTVVILTPGIYNSAYFEHVYLAKQMGVELVEGSDLLVDRDQVYMRTTRGLRPVHVIYRRVDDEWLDPVFGKPESMLGVPGLINAYRAGNVVIANAPGNGVADDKAVYALVPAIIRFYMGEDPILPNVETYLCADEKQRRFVLKNLKKLVVKRVAESGGHGMLIGPVASAKDLETFTRLVETRPRDFIAQPVVDLSVQPTLGSAGLRACHQDLRPFVLQGVGGVTVTPGGLTRVALRPRSLVVNSSQGGGSRDTWVLAAEEEPADA